MSRHPRSSRSAPFLLNFAALALCGTLVWSMAAVVNAAARDLTARTRGSSSQTILGAPNATACSDAAVAGRADEEAIRVCTIALKSERLNKANAILTHINRGALHLRRGEGLEALADFDAALARDPENPEAHLNRGAAMVLTSDPGGAVAAITQALQLGVREPHKAYFNRGAARESMKDYRGAYEDYNTALAIKPDWGPAEAELARFVRARRDRLAQAAADGLIVIDGPPQQPTEPTPSGTP